MCKLKSRNYIAVTQKVLFWQQSIHQGTTFNFMKQIQRLHRSDRRWGAGRFKMSSVTFALQMSESSVYSADSSLTLYSDSSKCLLTFPWDLWTSKEHQSCPWQFTLCQISPRERGRSAASPTSWRNATSRLCSAPERKRLSLDLIKEPPLVVRSLFCTRILPISTSFGVWTKTKPGSPPVHWWQFGFTVTSDCCEADWRSLFTRLTWWKCHTALHQNKPNAIRLHLFSISSRCCLVPVAAHSVSSSSVSSCDLTVRSTRFFRSAHFWISA